MKKGKKGTGYFFWEKEDCLYLQTVYIENIKMGPGPIFREQP
jgi:hypothetical protein